MFAVLCSMWGCGDGQTEPELVSTVVELAGAHCATGGQAIETGADINGNGALDATEVTHTSYVCGGADGQQPVIRIDAEPAGANCTGGGSAIHTGIDTNGDSIHEDSEIQSTTCLCGAARPTTVDGRFTVNNSVDAAHSSASRA